MLPVAVCLSTAVVLASAAPFLDDLTQTVKRSNSQYPASASTLSPYTTEMRALRMATFKLRALFNMPSCPLVHSDPKQNFAVDLGAGVRDDDPVFPMFLRENWAGLMVDGDPEQLPRMRQHIPGQHVTKVQSYVMPESIQELMRSNSVPSIPQVLKIDIDGIDCPVMRAVLSTFAPLVIIMEINPKYAPPLRFSLTEAVMKKGYNSERRGHFYGCSLSYQVEEIMHPRNYSLLQVDWNNAWYVHKSLLETPGCLDQTANPSVRAQHMVRTSSRTWFDAGYAKQPELNKFFGFNHPVIGWQTGKTPEENVGRVLKWVCDHPTMVQPATEFELGFGSRGNHSVYSVKEKKWCGSTR